MSSGMKAPDIKEMDGMRECGMLLPIASLPSRYGIGAFSKEAYEFVDQLKAAGQQYWQYLPVLLARSLQLIYKLISFL